MDFGSATLQLLEGFTYTLALFGITLLFSLPLGLLISFGSLSHFKPLSYLTRGFVWVIRGTPLMLQIIIVTFGPGLWLNTPVRTMFGKIMCVCIAFVINYACYFSEIYRGGILSVPQGQQEAGLVLGMTRREIFVHVTLMQVIKRVVAPMSNEVITLVKDTSLASIVLSVDIIYVAQHLQTRYVILWPLFIAGLFYLLFNGLLTVLLGKLEKKLGYFKV